MTNGRDPVEENLGSSRDLYDIATWEARSRLDRLAVSVHVRLKRSGRVLLIAVARFGLDYRVGRSLFPFPIDRFDRLSTRNEHM